MRDPFLIESSSRDDVKRRSLSHFSQSREQGTEATWLFPGHDTIHVGTDLRRLRWAFVIMCCIFAVFIIRVSGIQIVHGDEYRSSAEENRIRIIDIPPPRGIVMDRSREQLATNTPDFLLSVVPADLPKDQGEKTKVLEKVSSLLNIKYEEVEKKVSSVSRYSYEPLVIADQIPHDLSVVLEIEVKKLPGIEMSVSSLRHYSDDTSYSHILGYTGKLTQSEYDAEKKAGKVYQFNDVIGKTGIESMYEDTLRGIMGKKEIEVDALGNEQKVIAESPPVPGSNLVLTVRAGLQQMVTERLAQALKDDHTSTGATAVVLDPRTGEVLAMVSSPTFSSNSFAQGISPEEYRKLSTDPKLPLFNRAISGEYPSGSVIKPVIAAAGLQEHVITPQTTYLSTGGVRIGDWFFPDWKAGGHGVTDVYKALAQSVNTFFYYTGGGDNQTFTGLGVDRIRKYAELFGLNALLGIDLPGERPGFLPTKEWKERVKKEPWYIGDTYHLSIGQGDLLVTPLQVATYTSAIANGGTLYRPFIVKDIISHDGSTETRSNPAVIRSGFISPENIHIVKQGMREGVLTGSSRGLLSLPITSAAKTGTAQFDGDRTHGWFTSFAPYENPEIVVTVLIEGGGQGNDVALPVARDILSWWHDHPA